MSQINEAGTQAASESRQIDKRIQRGPGVVRAYKRRFLRLKRFTDYRKDLSRFGIRDDGACR